MSTIPRIVLASPLELETALLKHPAVKDVAVARKLDEKFKETTIGFVVKDPRSNISDAQLRGDLSGLMGNNTNMFYELLEEVQIRERCRMWYMHDGARPQFSLVAHQFLNRNYPNHWIGRGGQQPWPPRSPNMNPFDIYCSL